MCYLHTTYKVTHSIILDSYIFFSQFFPDPCEGITCSFNSFCVVDSNYKASCQCPKCPPTTKHVCGTDGRTYINECELRKQSCTTKTNIRVLHPGKCSKYFIILTCVIRFLISYPRRPTSLSKFSLILNNSSSLFSYL